MYSCIVDTNVLFRVIVYKSVQRLKCVVGRSDEARRGEVAIRNLQLYPRTTNECHADKHRVSCAMSREEVVWVERI